jgi:subtilisin family serine protease
MAETHSGSGANLRAVAQRQNMPVCKRANAMFVRDRLMVILKDGVNQDEFALSLAKEKLKIEKTIGAGSTKILLLKTEAGKMLEAEKMLMANPSVKMVQRDFLAKSKWSYTGPNTTPNDPDYQFQTYLTEMGIIRAWGQARGLGVNIGVADSGCDPRNLDIYRNLASGQDYINGGVCRSDDTGHGTCVASVLAAKGDNHLNGIGIARDSMIIPYKVLAPGADGSEYINESALIQAIFDAGNSYTQIMNISYAAEDAGNVSFANESAHAMLWQALRWYYDQKNGLAFFAMGGDGSFYDPELRLPYCIMVGAYNQMHQTMVNPSQAIWFTAPGENIYVSGLGGRTAYRTGSSFSCAMVSGIAALIKSKDSRLTNSQILSLMTRNCRNAPGSNLNDYYGYGIPQADQALQMISPYNYFPRIRF